MVELTAGEATLPQWWFGPPPQLAPGETWRASHPANRSQGKRAVGGGLHFTTHRVLFTPNVVDASLGGEPWVCSLDDIASVGVEPWRFAITELFSGGLRSRLRIDLRNDDTNMFVVSSPENVAAALEALRLATRDPSTVEMSQSSALTSSTCERDEHR